MYHDLTLDPAKKTYYKDIKIYQQTWLNKEFVDKKCSE